MFLLTSNERLLIEYLEVWDPIVYLIGASNLLGAGIRPRPNVLALRDAKANERPKGRRWDTLGANCLLRR